MKKMIAVVIMALLGVFGYGATETFAATGKDCVSAIDIVGNYEKSIFEEKDSYDHYIKLNERFEPNKSHYTVDAYFEDISISPALSTEITDYTATVESDVTYICVLAWDKYQHFFVKECNLIKGENIIQIAIPLEVGGEQKYTFRITRKKSSDNKISKIIVNEYNNKKVNLGQNEIICDKKSNKYSLNIPYHTTQVSVDVYIDANATV